MLFQVISRNNDVNGNPYRLVLCYDDFGVVGRVYEARASSPNIVDELRRNRHGELVPIHVAPSEYNEIKRAFKERLSHVD